MTFHAKTPYRRGVKVSHFLFFSVESYALADMLITVSTPYVEGEFESDDEDSLVEFMGSTTQGMGACHLIDV